MGSTKNQESHRPGAFKQSNKIHKTGRHRSKGAINNEIKGKQSLKTIHKKNIQKHIGKSARKHQFLQLRKNKMEETLKQKRNLGSASAPVLICIIPLQEDLEIDKIISKLESADNSMNIFTSPCGITHMSIPRLKQHFSIIVPPVGNVFATLDAAKVANTVMFATSATNTVDETMKEEIIDSWGNEILVSCMAQGLPTSIVVSTNVDKLPSKKRQDYKQRVAHTISKWLPAEKVFCLDTCTDSLNVLRRAATQKQRAVAYRTKRPYLLADQLKYTSDENSVDLGTLIVTGYLQGAPISVNGLIHISGLGDFQMSQIDIINSSEIEMNNPQKHSKLDEMDMKDDILTSNESSSFRADPNKQESLQSVNIPNLMDAEQTWPTDEEIAQAEAVRKKKLVKVVPKGTSAYQAAWIPDEDADNLSEYSDDESEDKMSMDDVKSQEDSEADMETDDEEYETITISEVAPDENKYDQDIDMTEEKEAIEKIKKAQMDAEFPDEVDTPQNMFAKVRFQKYRGLESFRTSPWDPKENLPQDYARIFQFKDFERVRKRVLKDSQEMKTASPGSYIRLHVANVTRDLFTAVSTLDDRPVILFGLLPNEQRISLINIVLKHTNSYKKAVKSKERLIFQCGYRRFSACPVFSEHTSGTKHKYERFFRPETVVVASMYAPITFPPCPVLCYVEQRDGSLALLATGSVLSANPDRLVVKRVVLSGYPFKIHKRSAVVRFMFFNREDINWFKPVELRTRHGRRGHIKEPLGTHGHMKCVFNGQLTSQDTVLMNLYKRVFPKWTYEPLLLNQSSNNDDMMMVE